MEKHIAVLLATGVAWLGAAASWGADAPPSPLSTYAETPWLLSRAEEIARTAPGALAEARRDLDAIRPELAAAFATAPGSVERERVEKRLEIADDLFRFVERKLAAGDPSSLQFAERGAEDLRLFLDYFREELELWPSNPDNPAVAPVVVDAADYGVTGDGKTCNVDAFARCFDAVRALGGAPCVVKLPAGDIFFGKSGKSAATGLDTQFSMPWLTNVVVEGVSPEATRFRYGVYDSRGGVIGNCSNVKLRNVELAWCETPFAEGWVEEADPVEGTCVIKANPRAKRPDEPCFKGNLTCQFDADGRICFDSSYAWLDPKRPPVDLGDGRFRISFEREKRGDSWKSVKAGRTLCIPNRNNNYHGMHMVGGRFVTLDSVWCRNSRAGAFSSSWSHQTACVRCRIFPQDGCVLSTCADGYYTASGSYFAHCDFTRMHDDGNNAHSGGAHLEAVEDGNALLYQWRVRGPKAGDLMLLVRPFSGQFLGNVRVREAPAIVERGGKRLLRVVFESLPEGLETIASLGMESLTAKDQQDILFNGKRFDRMPDQIYVPGLWGVGSVATDCRVSSLRGTAFPSQVPNELIESNTVENVSLGIRLCGLVQWMEGPPPYHAIVRGNTIRDCGDAILSKFEMPGHAAAAAAPITGCRFEGNRIENPARTAMQLFNLSDSDFIGNAFEGDPCRFEIRKCGDLRFEGNTHNGKPWDGAVPGR